MNSRALDAAAVAPTAPPQRLIDGNNVPGIEWIRRHMYDRSLVAAYPWLSITIVAVYLGLWLSHFPYVYGWIMDDRTDFIKGMDTIHDWRAAFAYYDALQPYFYLISYLPLASGFSLPSYPLPTFGAQTGQFKFFLLCALLLHAVLLLVWAWFAGRVSGSRAAAILSVALLATSPTYTLWSPQPESRLLGMLFALPALWLLLRSDGLSGWPRATVALPFVAGSLFGVAQSIHYTALYLIVPVSIAIWATRLFFYWRRREYWLGLLAFLVGCVWLQAIVEGVSDFVIGIPWQQGPTMTLLALRNMHASSWTELGNLQLWEQWFTSQMGLPLLVAAALGTVLFVTGVGGTRACHRSSRLALGLGLLLALVYLGVAGSMPLFRQTSVLQPFLFLFAAIAIIEVGRGLSRGRATVRFASTAGLLLIAGAIPWIQTYYVFKGHEGLGRALEWAYSHSEGRPIEWLNIAWYGESIPTITTQAQLEAARPDTLLITYFPWQFVSDRPSLLPVFQDTPPLAAFDTLWTTDTIYAEMQAYWPNFDWRAHPLMSQARVYAVGDLVANMHGAPLKVASVSADSAASDQAEPLNAVDHDASPDGHTAWLSADTPMPHWIDLQFEQPAWLGDVRIVEPPTPDRTVTRLDRLEVQVADEQHSYRTVWSQGDLHRQPVISAHWDPVRATDVRIMIYRELSPWSESNQAAIEEVAFPGYVVVAPAPTRRFPEIDLTSVVPTESGLLIRAQSTTPETVLMLDGQALPVNSTDTPGQLFAALPAERLVTIGPQPITAYLTDGLRVSREIAIVAGPPVVKSVDPPTFRVGTPFAAQADGSLAVGVICDGAVPGTDVLFDNLTLPTTYGNEHWLTATVANNLLNTAGHHTVALRNAFGESNRVAFDVTST